MKLPRLLASLILAASAILDLYLYFTVNFHTPSYVVAALALCLAAIIWGVKLD